MNCDYFFKINYTPEIIIDHYASKKLSGLPIIPYFGFTGAPLGPHIFLKDPMLNKLNNSYPILYTGVVKLDPYTIYDWHTDQRRTVALNMLLTAHNSSYSVFKTGKSGVIIDTIHLEYEPNTLYVFNTQKEHMVVNGGEDRWLFTVEFIDQIFYDDMVLWIKENGYG